MKMVPLDRIQTMKTYVIMNHRLDCARVLAPAPVEEATSIHELRFPLWVLRNAVGIKEAGKDGILFKDRTEGQFWPKEEDEFELPLAKPSYDRDDVDKRQPIEYSTDDNTWRLIRD